jgi:hypothetical protein
VFIQSESPGERNQQSVLRSAGAAAQRPPAARRVRRRGLMRAPTCNCNQAPSLAAAPSLPLSLCPSLSLVGGPGQRRVLRVRRADRPPRGAMAGTVALIRVSPGPPRAEATTGGGGDSDSTPNAGALCAGDGASQQEAVVCVCVCVCVCLCLCQDDCADIINCRYQERIPPESGGIRSLVRLTTARTAWSSAA